MTQTALNAVANVGLSDFLPSPTSPNPSGSRRGRFGAGSPRMSSYPTDSKVSFGSPTTTCKPFWTGTEKSSSLQGCQIEMPLIFGYLMVYREYSSQTNVPFAVRY